ncbi:Pentatricopeptide repeat-containing protein At1g09900 [Linum perenne]
MRSRGFEPDEFTCSIVVSGMCRLGRLDEAIKLVSSMNPCVVSYNTVLNELCNSRRLTDAENLFKDMPCSPSEATFRILIRSLCRKSSSDRAMELLESMPRYGCIPDACHYNLVIHCLCKEKKMGKAIEYIEVMTSRGCSPTTAIFNTMLAAFWRDGKVDAAVDLFNQLSCYSRNLATYFISIEGFSRLGRTDEALELLDELRSSSSIKGFKPNPECYTALIIALIREARVDESMEILDELNGSKVGVRSKYYNWIVCALCNVGEIDRGIDVLACMVSKGCKPWNASYGVVIEGLARAGFGREGMELVNELLLKGIVDEDWTKNVAARIERICR